jgi:metal-dependent HD superfamily phosphatase/phosphodiesterase
MKPAEMNADLWISPKILTLLMENREIEALQNQANSVSIVRLGYNDHGPVHMRIVTLNALKILHLLNIAKIKTDLERDSNGCFDDSVAAVCLAAFVHDIGMSVSREDHEMFSIMLGLPLINAILDEVLPGDHMLCRKTAIRAAALEGIAGHMATRRIHSIEAGIILVADGCDMAKGRARIPIEISKEAKAGDIHKYSADAIENVLIRKGDEKPLCIEISMLRDVGFFQVEEVLIPKLNMSPAKQYIELIATITGETAKRYF